MSKEKELEELKEKMDFIESIDFSYVAKGGQVKMIAWGKDYMNWDIAKRLEFSEALASAMNEAAEVMQNERNIAMEEALRLQKQLESAQENLNIVRNTNIRAITDFNTQKQEMAKRIKELESQVRSLEVEQNIQSHLGH